MKKVWTVDELIEELELLASREPMPSPHTGDMLIAAAAALRRLESLAKVLAKAALSGIT